MLKINPINLCRFNGIKNDKILEDIYNAFFYFEMFQHDLMIQVANQNSIVIDNSLKSSP